MNLSRNGNGNGNDSGPPFRRLHTIQHFIMPNFGTLDWERIGHQPALENFGRLHDEADAVYDDIMMYLHVPYCKSICHYCNFNRFAYPRRNVEWLEKYVDYLIKEIDFYMRLPYVHTRRFTSLYIGGGSPSVLPVGAAERLFEHLSQTIPDWSTIEKTFTGEPRTLRDPDLLALLVDYGFDRITFGVETFNDDIRKAIGRWDSLDDVTAVYSNLDKLRFDGDLCMDLMFDLPGQTFDDFRSDLDTMVKEAAPDELDAYGTIYLPYRPLHRMIIQEQRQQPGPLSEMLRMREYLWDFMAEHGYNNTIAETWSKRSDPSEYQTAHCARQDIIGIGAAARSNLKDMVSINPAGVEHWMGNIDEHGVSTENLQSIGREGVLDRIMVMFPRFKELGKDLFASYSDAKNHKTHKKILARHIDSGVVEERDDRWVVNRLGVQWICNLQTDYMKPSLNLLGKVLLRALSEPRTRFDRENRFRVNRFTRFIADNVEKYPKLMK